MQETVESHALLIRSHTSDVNDERGERTSPLSTPTTVAAKSTLVAADEIALNPEHFGTRSIEDVLSTLVHEMVHLWQHHFGKPGRRRYHNKQWAEKMEAVGLGPSDTGKPGGNRTGESMTHFIIKDGAYAQVAAKLLTGGFEFSWVDRAGGTGRRKTKKKVFRVKYSCPKCGVNAWAKPEVKLVCGVCNNRLRTT